LIARKSRSGSVLDNLGRIAIIDPETGSSVIRPYDDVVYVGGDTGYYGYDRPRARIYEHDRGWHRGWYHHDRDFDRGVVIRRHHWDD